MLADTEEKTTVATRIRQFICGITGHDELAKFEEERMFLLCHTCGHQTPGWELNEVPPTVTVKGDMRHRMIRRSVGA